MPHFAQGVVSVLFAQPGFAKTVILRVQLSSKMPLNLRVGHQKKDGIEQGDLTVKNRIFLDQNHLLSKSHFR